MFDEDYEYIPTPEQLIHICVEPIIDTEDELEIIAIELGYI